MTTQEMYLISCVALLVLANCNVYAHCKIDCEEDAQFGDSGYFASGSAISSQILLPSGEVVTQSKGSSFSSDGIQKTFQQLKHEANQFVTKQKDTINIPNALPLPALHSSFGQDVHSHGQLSQVDQVGYPAGYFNKVESSKHHQEQQQILSGSEGSHTSQVYYQPIPQTSKVITKKEQITVNKKVISHGGSGSSYSSGSGLDEIETNQNKLDSNLKRESLIYQPAPSYVNNVKAESGNTKEEFETVKTNVQVPPVVIPGSSQTSFSKYEKSVKHNSSSQVVPNLPVYIPNGQFTTGIINLNGYENDNMNKQHSESGLHTFITPNVPASDKLTASQNEHNFSHSENKDSSYYQNIGSAIDSEVNSQQQEHKFEAVPVYNQGTELPIKIKYIFDGKTLKKYEIYSSGVTKDIPISIEESESALREIRKQSSHSSQSQSYITQPLPVSHEKPEPEGYYYYPKGQAYYPSSNVQTHKTEESQSSHSQQSITSGNVDQFSHLPLRVNPQKQYAAGYVGIVPPSSQMKYEVNSQSDSFSKLQQENPAILIGGVPQTIPIPVQSQHSSFSSGSSSHSSSYTGGSSGGLIFPPDSFSSTKTSSKLLEKLSSMNSGSEVINCGDCVTGMGASLPVKNTYGIATSFSSSSSSINGKKTENRQASVTMNDNGKVDTYKVKS